MSYHDVPNTLRRALAHKISTLRYDKKDGSGVGYKGVCLHHGSHSGTKAWQVQTSSKDRGQRLHAITEDIRLARIVAAAVRYDDTLKNRTATATWLNKMSSGSQNVDAWIADNVPDEDLALSHTRRALSRWGRRGSKRVSAKNTIRRVMRTSPSVRAWREHVKYKPGNTGFVQAQGSYDRARG